LAVWVSARPADREHPYGHWNAESIAQGIVGIIILLVGLNLIYSNTTLLLQGEHAVPEAFTMLAALFSLVLKEVTYRYTYNLGVKYNSPVVTASAHEHRSDAFSSLAAFLGILAATLGEAWGIEQLAFMDVVAGILVSFLILRMGFQVLRESATALMDRMPPDEVQEEIKEAVLKQEGINELHELRARYSGPCLQVDVVIGVDGNLSVEEGHQLADKVEKRLKNNHREITSVWVHVHPCKEGKDFV